jgi:hypothetical protein
MQGSAGEEFIFLEAHPGGQRCKRKEGDDREGERRFFRGFLILGVKIGVWRDGEALKVLMRALEGIRAFFDEVSRDRNGGRMGGTVQSPRSKVQS